MNQNKPKQSNATHNLQQRFAINFSLPYPELGKFWQYLHLLGSYYLLRHFEEELHFLSIYKSSRWHINKGMPTTVGS